PRSLPTDLELVVEPHRLAAPPGAATRDEVELEPDAAEPRGAAEPPPVGERVDEVQTVSHVPARPRSGVRERVEAGPRVRDLHVDGSLGTLGEQDDVVVGGEPGMPDGIGHELAGHEVDRELK